MADTDLHRLDEWFGRIVRGLAPARRKRAAMKLGQALRRANLGRIAKNITPDGAPMERKKARYDHKGRLRAKAGGLMFKGLRRAKNWKIDATEDGVEIKPINGLIARIGEVSQFGETATVGRLRNRQRIRTRYPERPLLGFGPEDDLLALEIAEEMMNPDR